MSSAHRYLDVLDRVAEAHANAKSAKSAKSGPRTKAEAAQNSQNAQNSHAQGPASKWEACDQSDKRSPPGVPVDHEAELRTPFGRLSRFGRTLHVLESRCPDHVPALRWQQCVEDGKRFLARWGEQTEALRWTARDLFGLQTPPAKPHPSYSRLSRYDETGLIWLLQGRLVVALTETTAAIQNPTGAITTYRRHNKPALGPPGDSLDDPNDDKERDYSGTLDVGGEEFWVSGWVKTSKAGRKYLSIAVKKKVEKPAKSEKSLAEDCNDQIPF
jgi:hypothetical protein